ncbi:MAG: hypothetical protein EOP58_10235, partial [Sphingomonadales bacterium]
MASIRPPIRSGQRDQSNQTNAQGIADPFPDSGRSDFGLIAMQSHKAYRDTMTHLSIRWFLAIVLISVLGVSAAHAQTAAADPRVAWRLLDYLAVDYSGAVENGQVISAGEFAEMNEFAASAEARIKALPSNASKPALLTSVRVLRTKIGQKASPADVGATARRLAADLLIAYPAALAPTTLPDMGR